MLLINFFVKVLLIYFAYNNGSYKIYNVSQAYSWQHIFDAENSKYNSMRSNYSHEIWKIKHYCLAIGIVFTYHLIIMHLHNHLIGSFIQSKHITHSILYYMNMKTCISSIFHHFETSICSLKYFSGEKMKKEGNINDALEPKQCVI